MSVSGREADASEVFPQKRIFQTLKPGFPKLLLNLRAP